MSLTPAATETLFALGVGDRIVGKAEDVFLYPPEAGAIPDVAGFDSVDIEKIVSLEPDLVIAGGNFFTPAEAIEQLRSLDVPVVVVYAPSVETALDDIELIGQTVGRSDEAVAITDRIRTEFEAVEAAVAGEPRPRVFYELDATGAFYGPADESFLAEMIELAGAEPITTGSPDKYDIAVERLIEADPELILLADAPFGVTPEQVAARPGLGRHDRGPKRRHPPDRRPDRDAAGSAAVRGPAAARLDHPPGRPDPVDLADPGRAGGALTRWPRTATRCCDRPSGSGRASAPDPAWLLAVGGRRGAPRVDRRRHRLRLRVDLAVRHAGDRRPAPVRARPRAHLVRRSQAIVWDLRVPRVLLAGVVGVALALAGATFQGLMRNPLADPYVLGTASGAALGAAVGVLLPVRAVVLGFGLVQRPRVRRRAGRGLGRLPPGASSGLSPMTGLLLTGYAVGSLLAAALALAMFTSGAALRQIFGYLLGGFEGATWERLAGASLLVAIGGTLLILRARSLNGLLLGEEAAAHLGIDVRRERGILIALGSLVTAAAVAVSGLIGFVGLVVPHVVRLLVGPSARLVLPLSALVGASLLILADVVARALGDIPVGVVTAVIGAPFFLLLLRRARSGYEL